MFWCRDFTTAESRGNVWHRVTALKPPVAMAAVCSKAVVLVLSIHLFIVALMICGVSVLSPCFVMQYLVAFLVFSFAIIFMRKRELVALLQLSS